MKATGSVRQKFLNTVSFCLARTNVAPFTWVYRALTRAAVRAAVLYLKRGGILRSLYLIRGFARGEEVYGQSDLDLLVIVKEDALVPVAAARYRTIVRICPLFDKTHGITGWSRIQSLYRDYDVSRYRYNIDSGHWKLLYGDDVRKYFSDPITGLELDRSLLAELCKIWNNLTQNMTNRRIPRFKINYLMGKFQPETERVLSHGATAGCEAPGATGSSSARIKAKAGGEQFHTNKNRPLIHPGMRRIDSFSRAAASAYHQKGIGTATIAASVREADLFLSESARNRMQTLQSYLKDFALQPDRIAVLPRILNPSVRSLLNPRVETATGRARLSYLGTDDVCLYLLYNGDPPIVPLMHWAADSGQEEALQRVDVFVTLPCAAFCLSNHGAYWDARPSIQSPVTSPILFSLLFEAGMIPRMQGIDYDVCPGEIARWLEREALEEISLTLQHLRSDPTVEAPIGRYRGIVFLLQSILMVEGFRRSRLDLPLTSRAVARRLREETAGALEWVEEFQGVYESLLDGRTVPKDAASRPFAMAMDYACDRAAALNGGNQA
jgi:hypothetical protein